MEPKDQQLVVALRIRPLNSAEQEEGATVIAHKVGDQVVVLMDPRKDPEDTLCVHRSREQTFIFDTVFDQHASQEDVYHATMQHLVEGVTSGYNTTVFAYGPSGAGKTHTMLGVDSEPGIYLQTLTDLFQAIQEAQDNTDYSVSLSYLEIYNEVIRDLLNPSSGRLELREDARGIIQIAGITEVSTSNAQEIMQLLTKGNRQRTQEPTAANKTSSRSHAVLQVTVHQRSRAGDPVEEVRLGRLFMVDLAGSEHAAQTQGHGRRVKEGAHINRSLLTLGSCINAPSERGKGGHASVNFRDSKLTWLLKDALGGNSRTVMIAHISPASTSFEESRTTLLYACRAKNIKTRVKHNLLTMSYRAAQYTDVISNLHREIELLKSKIEKQQKEKAKPSVLDVQVTVTPHDAEEESCLQMDRIWAQLAGAVREQLAIRRSLVELENASIELRVDTSRHLLTIADWEREKSHHHVHRDRAEPDKDEEPVDAGGDEGESAEPHEVAMAREAVHLLSAEQQKTAALKAQLEQRLAHAKRNASQMERLLPERVTSEAQREALRLLCRAHELEVEKSELQADNLHRKNLLGQKEFLMQRHLQHRLLCEPLVHGQRQLLRDSGVTVPEPLEQRYRLYCQELGEDTLDRLLLLQSPMSSLLQDGSVLNVLPPPPEESSSRNQPDDRKDLARGLFEAPVLLDRDSDGDRSSKSTPLRKLRKQGCPRPLPPLCVLLTPPTCENPGSPGVKTLVSKLHTPARPALSAKVLKEVALDTKSISLIAASRRGKMQDHKGSGSRSCRHLLEDAGLDCRDLRPSATPDSSPADRRWPRASPCGDRPVERKARRKQSPSLIWHARLVTEKPRPPSADLVADSQLPPAHLQPSKSPGKTFFPAVPIPVGSKSKPSLSFHTDENILHVPDVTFTFPSAVWQTSAVPSRPYLLPHDIRGSTDSGGRRHSPLTPSNTHWPRDGSTKRPPRPR